MAKFGLRPQILADESATGYLLRAFEINGFRWSPEKFAGMGFSLSEILKGKSESALREIVGVDVSSFAAATADVRSTTRVVLAGEELRRLDWTTSARRWCPACFAGDFANVSLGGRLPGWRLHRRFWWDVASVQTCPVHHVRLENACPECKVPVTWSMGTLTACRHGHSLIPCEPVPVAPEHTRADAYIVGRLGGMPRIHADALDAMTLGEAISTMEHLGVASFGGAQGCLGNIDPSAYPEVFSAGFDIAAGMPGTLDALLGKLACQDGLGAWGLHQIYGYLLEWSRTIRATNLGKTVSDAILAHHAGRTIIRGYSAAAAFVGDDTPVSVNEVSIATGRAPETINACLKAMGYFPEKTRRGTPIIAPRAVMNEIVALFEDSIMVADICVMLGIHRTQVMTLLKAGILKPVPFHAKLGTMVGCYSRKETGVFLDRLAGDAPFVGSVPSRLLPIVGPGSRNDTGGIESMIPLILDGKVPVQGRLIGATGLKSLLVDPEAFRRLRRSATVEALGLADAKKILGMGINTLTAAIEIGLLERVDVRVRTIVVTQKSVLEFPEKYVSAETIAQSLASRPRFVIALLTEVGVKPVLSTDINPRARGTIYRRRDIPEDLAVRYRERYRFMRHKE
jgi:hypothetical protein